VAKKNVHIEPENSSSGSGTLQNVRKVFDMEGAGDLVAVKDVSFSFNGGQVVSLLGPSGCGKTTVLKMIGGLVKATSGDIIVSSSLVNGPYENVGMVFQTPTLMPWRSVLSNIKFPLEVLGKPLQGSEEKVARLLDLTNLTEFNKAWPHELSGGMQQRVSLCRALIHSPELLLMDEPFGALDELTRMEMNDLLLKINYQEKNTVIFVTHSISEAIYLSDTVHVFSKRPAEIKKTITIDIPHPRKSSDRYTEHFKQLELDAGEALGVIR
jgi:NitT/TauT family transport system ATP-binding protein